MASHRASSLLAPYSCSKFGVKALTVTSHRPYIVMQLVNFDLQQCAARELAVHNITVNSYCPGYVDTEMWGSVDAIARQYTGDAPGEFRKKCESEIALGRQCQPEDVANFVSFLASPGSNYITGQSILVDGGCLFV